MFEWFRKKKTPASSLATDPIVVLLALGRGLEHAQNLLRLGQDEKAAEQLRMMALPAAMKLQNLAEAFKTLVDLFDLLVKTRQIDLARQILPFVERASKAAGGNAPTLAQHLHEALVGIANEPTPKPKSGIEQVTVVYVCQSCGAFNNFLMSPCMTCGFLPSDEHQVRLGMFLSNAYLAVNALNAFGYRISQGTEPEALHKDLRKNLERIPMVEARNILAKLRDSSPARSGRFPIVPVVSKCPKCSVQLVLSTDVACNACATPLQLPPIQRFIIATSRALRITQEMISPPETPAFGRLLGLLVAFENNAFESGEAPSSSERKDAIACMHVLKFLPTSDGVLRIIFSSDDIQIGMNQTPGELKFAPEDYISLGQEWIAVHGYLKNGVPLR